MSGQRRACILVVDDDPAVTSLLRRGFAYEGYEVSTADSGPEALRLARERPPALVVLDVMMPEMDGLEVCRRLREADPSLPILLLTARDAPADQIAGLDTGADDYVTKPFSFEVLSARVRALLRRREGQQPEVLVYEDLRLDTGARIAFRGDRQINLTTTEYELLHLLMSHPRQVLTKDQIMERVWGYDFGGNANIVEVYVGALRRKLEEQGEPRLIQTVRGAGYALREE
ncbi:MAG: DNA-binding response regulator [Chloroflexi bacterium RBG_16_68_14]|nr:MAG: DNA-binding response regulator [Chloroflexi bacterium RBG_16_68_14]